MGKTEREAQFEEYRVYLQQEITRVASYARLYRRLYDRRTDRLAEMNLAPAFFSVVTDALFQAIVLWTDKLFDEKSERGLWNFLTFCENNRKILEVSELKRRNNYQDGHWMLNRKPITFQSIKEDKERIRNLPSLRSFKLRRDKFIAHFDKDYFFKIEKLSDDAPLIWDDFENAVKIMADIINTYSSAYDGNLYVVEPVNITDIDRLLDRLHRGK